MAAATQKLSQSCDQVHSPTIINSPLPVLDLKACFLLHFQYFHNGEDKLEDRMTLVASTGTKTSMPATLTIRVLPVNDEMPLLVNNTGLEVWAGATTPITNRHLGKNCILEAAAAAFLWPQTRSFVFDLPYARILVHLKGRFLFPFFSPQWYPNHTDRNLHFLSKKSTLISGENCQFFLDEKLVKMLWFWTF